MEQHSKYEASKLLWKLKGAPHLCKVSAQEGKAFNNKSCLNFAYGLSKQTLLIKKDGILSCAKSMQKQI